MCSKIGSGATPTGGSTKYQESGVAFIRSQNVFDHHFSDEGLVFIDDFEARKLAAVTVQPEDVLLNITGDGDTIARCCVVPEHILPARVNQHVLIIRPHANKLVPRYLQRYLSHPTIREYMLSFNSGGSRRALTKGHAESFRVVVPPPSEQHAIADVLGALDDKIEANRWLVDRCDATWRATLTGEGDMCAKPLSALAAFINGRAFTKNATGTGRMVVRIAELNSGPGGSTVYNDIEVPDEHLVRPGDLLFAWSASLTVARWYRPEAIINQHIFKVVPKSDTPLWLVHAGILELLELFRGIAADKATTMGHIQRRHLDEHVLVPKPERVRELDRWCEPLWQRALAAEQECLTLSSLRDALLPKLLSGELRIREAETLVGEAV
jgi:type I restriction enzyme S subunit